MANEIYRAEAREKFQRSVTRAQLADLIGLISGQVTDLVSFDEVAQKLKARQQIEMGTQMVQLNKIVGSVGRYRDFTRTFLPRSGADQGRWANLDAAMNALESVPPIELFKIGDVYFVRDGNHRVSVARANGASHIEAYVTEVKSPIPLTVDDFERDQWLIKAERADFLEHTHLDQLRPGSDIILTEPGRYAMLIEHIEVHRYLRNLDLERANDWRRLTWGEAICSWYDTVYMPMIEAIRSYNLIEQFPSRTEADLYLWLALYRERLATQYDLAPLDPETAVSTFAEANSDNPLGRTWKGLRLGLHRLMMDDRPLGMSQEAFQQSRARHDAGEISLTEANHQVVQLEPV